MPLSPKGRRAARELEREISFGNTRRVLQLIDGFGLSTGDRIGVAQELHRRATTIRDDHEVELRFDRFDQAHIRGLAQVWARGR
jgi:hypothetical protein